MLGAQMGVHFNIVSRLIAGQRKQSFVRSFG
jgi:hypothetical protein